MVSKQKVEFAVLLANKSIRNKFSELLLQIHIEAKECKVKDELKVYLNSLKFKTSFLIIELKLVTGDSDFLNNLIEYSDANPTKQYIAFSAIGNAPTTTYTKLNSNNPTKSQLIPPIIVKSKETQPRFFNITLSYIS